jgi:hypothetical protein
MSYLTEHPTSYSWNSEVREVVAKLQAAYPWQTFLCTYWWHPPFDEAAGVLRDYQAQSFDVWGGGKQAGVYTGYRGKPLPKRLGRKIYKDLWEGRFGGPDIAWIIWEGKMWIRGVGERPAPAGAADSDPGHFGHVHCTLGMF